MTAHRSRICFEVETVLSAYFRPSERDEIKDAQLAWWADTLIDFRGDSIVVALRKWNVKHPRQRPTPGDILAILKEGYGRKVASQAKPTPKQDPEPTTITDEERERRKAFVERTLKEVAQSETPTNTTRRET